MKFTKYTFAVAVCIMLAAVSAYGQEIDPGTGIRIGGYSSLRPVWSPDGAWIAHCGGWDGIWLLPAEGGDPVQLFSKPSLVYDGHTYAFMITQKPCFTPDNKEIVFTSYLIDPERGTEAMYWKPASGESINHEIPILMAVDITTKETRLIREEALVGRFSRDGKYFGYINYDHRAVTDPANAEHHYSIAVEDTETGDTVYLTDGVGTRTRDFSFSADNSYIIAMVEMKDYSYKLYKVPMDGSEPTVITTQHFTFMDTPECSPDGRWVMFTGSEDYGITRQLFVYDDDTGAVSTVFPETVVDSSDGSWSPDGKKFCANLALSEYHVRSLYVFDFDPEQIGISPQLAEVPLYIPRDFGAQIIEYSFDIESIKPDSIIYVGTGERVPEESSLYTGYQRLEDSQRYPVLSPDGTWVACTEYFSTSGIWIVPSEGGDPIRVLDDYLEYQGYYLYVGGLTVLSFTPDSREIVFAKRIIDEDRGTVVTITEGTTSTGGRHFGYNIKNLIDVIMAVDIYTGQTRLVMDSANEGSYSHSGKYLAYRTSQGNAVLYDTETGESKTLTDYKVHVYGFSPDDSYIVALSGTSCIKLPLSGGPSEVLKPGYCYDPDISPDGQWLLYTNQQRSLSIYNIETGDDYTLLRNYDDFTCSSGKFSPDGTKIMYCLDHSGNDNWTRLYTIDFDPSEFAKPSAVGDEQPVDFAVVGNYPNPFNMSTSIVFSVNSTERVDLSVYNMAGQRIRGLLSDTALTPGIHRVLWDGHDDYGRPVSSGVYITRLRGKTSAASGRMMLVK